MIPDKDTIQDLAKTEPVHPLVLGNDVYDRFIFQPTLVRFTRKQYVFLNTYRLGVPLEEAAAKADMTRESADRFLSKADTVAWLKDRALKDHIRDEWSEPAKWWTLGDEVLEGKRSLNKSQTEVWKEFGKRIQPLSDHASSGTKIEINIDGEALQRSKERRKSIEAQIVKDEHAA